MGPLTAFDGQLALYHVDFRDRQLSISSNPIITSFAGGTTPIAEIRRYLETGIDGLFSDDTALARAAIDA